MKRQRVRGTGSIFKRDRVWWATPGAVADFCYTLPPGIIPGEGAKQPG